MKILFAADMSFNYIPECPDAAQAREAMKEPAALFAAADFSMLNLENILGVREENEPIIKDGPNLISDPRFAEYVRALHPTVIGMANNHTKDYGERPMLETKELFEREGYVCIGAGKNLDEAYRPAILEKDGVKVAIIAACENEFGTATKTTSGTSGYSLSRITHAINDAKQIGAHPIIYFHGGHEGNPFPSPARQELCRHFVELGAVAVISMHTHCPQGYEIYQGAPIVYSMGNFFFPHFPGKKDGTSWNYGYMSELNVTKDAVTLSVHPYRFDSKITVLKGEEKTHFDAYLDYITAPIASTDALRAWFDSWCLTPERYGYYGNFADLSIDLLADGHADHYKRLKNTLGCEAHAELVKNLLYMLYEGRVETARPGVKRIELLQHMQIPNC